MRCSLASWLAVGVLAAFPAVASGESDESVLVFYPRGDCRGNKIELEVFDREEETWVSHLRHRYVPVETCQAEDAGVLFNEIRWRCVEEPGALVPSVWVVGLEVFDPEVMERCTIGRLERGVGETVIHVSSPSPGETIRNVESRTRVLGSVRMNGLPGQRYDVVLLLDRSGAMGDGRLDAEVRAARAWVRSLGDRLGSVRVGIVGYPNMPPRPGEDVAARVELALSSDGDRIQRALHGLKQRGASGPSSFAAGLELALAELDAVPRDGSGSGDGARPVRRARPIVIAVGDGRGRRPFGAHAETDPAYRSRVLELAKLARRRGVALYVFALGGLAEEPTPFVRALTQRSGGSFVRIPHDALGSAFFASVALPTIREVVIENPAVDAGGVAVSLDAEGRFVASVPLAAGDNPLRVRVLTSDGRWSEREWRVAFDDALILEQVLAEERARIRAAQEKRLEVRPEHARP